MTLLRWRRARDAGRPRPVAGARAKRRVVALGVRLALLAPLAGLAWRLSAQSAPAAAPAAGAPAVPQDSVTLAARAGADAPGAADRLAVPFGPGERLTYEVRFGVLKVGTGTMEIDDLATVRGREAYHSRFRVRGGTFFYKVDDLFESWFDTRSLAVAALQPRPERGEARARAEVRDLPRAADVPEGDKAEERSVADPLDEGSFLYYVRTLPLRNGDTYELHRYFRPDRNPVRIRVLRRERVTVPAGTFNAIVVQPTIRRAASSPRAAAPRCGSRRRGPRDAADEVAALVRLAQPLPARQAGGAAADALSAAAAGGRAAPGAACGPRASARAVPNARAPGAADGPRRARAGRGAAGRRRAPAAGGQGSPEKRSRMRRAVSGLTRRMTM
jgi:hypothetical protein